VLVEQVAQLRFGPNQVDANRKGAAGEDSSLDLRLRSFVGPYGVEDDVSQHMSWRLLGCFFDVQHCAALVGSALGASVVGTLLFVTAGALGEAVRSEKVVCTAVGGAAR
jgi:hypothetical protein